jgi:guanylate kinase
MEKKINWNLFNRMISDTTRPARSNEVDGVDYNFTNNAEFDKKLADGGYYEHTVYVRPNGDKWQYGMSAGQVLADKVNLTVVNPHGAKQLKQSPIADKLKIVLIKSDRDVRIARYLARETGDETVIRANLEKRLADDDKDFMGKDAEILTGASKSIVYYNNGTNIEEYFNDLTSKILNDLEVKEGDVVALVGEAAVGKTEYEKFIMRKQGGNQLC